MEQSFGQSEGIRGMFRKSGRKELISNINCEKRVEVIIKTKKFCALMNANSIGLFEFLIEFNFKNILGLHKTGCAVTKNHKLIQNQI